MPVELEMFLYFWKEQIGFPCLLLPECKCICKRWRLLIFGSVAILDKLGMEVFYFEADRYIGRLRLLTVCAFQTSGCPCIGFSLVALIEVEKPYVIVFSPKLTFCFNTSCLALHELCNFL